MATPTVHQRPDTREMVVVHDLFRREFGNLPGLVRGVAPGDTERAAVVVEFLRELASGLHHHHTGEDELMWPLLLERCTADGALILRMEEQHERIAALHDRAVEQAAAFEGGASAEAGERLAQTLTTLTEALDEHMREEEVHVLPLVERHLSVAEWEALGERGRAGLSKDRLLIQLGFILLGTSAQDRAAFLAQLPLPARIAWRLVGRRRFTAEYRRIYLTAPSL
jgi:hemerythrin-like domain-containing protein